MADAILATRRGYATWGNSFDELLASFAGGPAELRAFVGDGPLLSDDRPLTEYVLSLPRERTVDFSRFPRGRVEYYVTD